LVPGEFVGRAAEIAALRDQCRLVYRDRLPAVAVVVGDPGAGKSRLLAELRRLDGVPPSISIAGYELEESVPLTCARELIERLCGAPEGSVLREFVAQSRPSGDSVDQVRLFEAAHRAISSLVPVLVVVDDMQWADDTSLALVHYLVRAAHDDRRPVALVVGGRRTVRATELVDSYVRILGADRVRRLDLGPLDRLEGITLARQLDSTLDERGAEDLWRRAGGSPFWLEALTSDEHGDADIATIVARRVQPLRADAASVLAVVAIAGRPTLTEDVAEIQRWPLVRAEEAAAVLEDRGLVLHAGGLLWIAHDLIGAAVLRTIPAARARRLHARVGAWLLVTAGDDERLLLDALEHLRRSGEPVLALAVRLAGGSRRRLLGISGLEQLAAILDEARAGDPLAEELRARLAQLASDLGQPEEALRHWSECASASDDPVAAGRAALRASEAAMALSRRHEAWRQWERARSVGGDAALAVEIDAQESALQWFLEHRLTASRSAAEAALVAGRELADRSGGIDALGDPVRRALLCALGAATDSSLSHGDVDAMQSFSEERASLAAGFDERVHLRALVDGALALRLLGRNADAEARLRPLWDRVRRHVLPQATLEVGALFGTVLRSLGRLVEAEAVVDECAQLGVRLVEFGPSRAFAIALPSQIAVSRGDWRRAVDGLRTAAATEPDPHYRLQAHMERAVALALVDPLVAVDEIGEAVSASLADAEASRCERCLAEATARGAESLARSGDVAGARALLDSRHLDSSDAYGALCVRRARAVLTIVDGLDLDAVGAVEAVITDAERQGLNLDALRARLDLGALLARSDRGRAVEVIRAAGAQAERFGARTEQHLAERSLRSLGVRTWRRAATGGGEDQLSTLSDREREIAAMVSAGSTNPEIAAAVFLSRKTVERHVSNILAKLGMRNRAELAALSAELRANRSAS
jgi:DNA-binding NarL/FixJ family response regulator/tetratricopeptide (TPR) repeat protein